MCHLKTPRPKRGGIDRATLHLDIMGGIRGLLPTGTFILRLLSGNEDTWSIELDLNQRTCASKAHEISLTPLPIDNAGSHVLKPAALPTELPGMPKHCPQVRFELTTRGLDFFRCCNDPNDFKICVFNALTLTKFTS